MSTRILVVTTVWNTPADWLRECIRSVQTQDVPAHHVLVDDGSDRPDTVAVLREFEAAGGTVLWLPHRGVGNGLPNRAIEGYRAEYVAILDSDDALVPGSLRARRDHLDAHPEVALVSGYAELVDVSGTPFRVTKHGGTYTATTPPSRNGTMLRPCHSGNMFRREWWERVGGYPDLFPGDEAFHGRLLSAGALFSNLGTVVVRRRIWQGSAWAPSARAKLTARLRKYGRLRPADKRLLHALKLPAGGRE